MQSKGVKNSVQYENELLQLDLKEHFKRLESSQGSKKAWLLRIRREQE
jgi:hypothetical protein